MISETLTRAYEEPKNENSTFQNESQPIMIETNEIEENATMIISENKQ